MFLINKCYFWTSEFRFFKITLNLCALMKNLMKRLAATAFCLALLPLTGCGDDNTDDLLIPPPL